MPSATVSGPVFSSNPIAKGLNVGVFAQVKNTGGKARYSASITAHSECDDRTYLIGQSTLGFNPGETKNLSVSWPIPTDACSGEYIVEVELEARNEVIAYGIAPLTVT